MAPRGLQAGRPAWAADPTSAKIAGVIALAAAGAGVLALLGEWAAERESPAPRFRRRRPPPDRGPERTLHAASALLSAAVLADSAVEHYRGSFENPGMYTPLLTSALGVAAGIDGATAARLPRRVRDGVYGLASAVGAVGFGFHVFNVLRKPGGLNWLNLFYQAPIGAPAALTLAGGIGLSADALADARQGEPPRLLGVPAGRFLSGLTSFGLLGTVGEVALLHFRGSFQNPFMFVPVSFPPVAAALMGKAAAEPARPRPRLASRAWLAITAAIGVIGVGFHAFGVSRAMGGWRNWSQNLVDGPPLPAPPAFSALALAGLAALKLRDREDA